MKTLSFDSVEKYEVLYEGLTVAQSGYKGREVVQVSRVFDKLESIGKKKDERAWTLSTELPENVEEGVSFLYPHIEVEDDDFGLILRAFDTVAWNATGARVASKVYDWLHSIK